MPVDVKIARRVWNKAKCDFVETGEVITGDVVHLEALADKLARPRRQYLKGPLPWPWIAAASKLPGKALLVGFVYLAACRRDEEPNCRVGQRRP